MDNLFINIKMASLRLTDAFKKSLRDESGMGVIEVTLIIVVLVGLAILFRNEINSVASSVFGKLKEQVNEF